MAVERKAVTQPSRPASGGGGDHPKATGNYRSRRNGTGNHSQKRIRRV